MTEGKFTKEQYAAKIAALLAKAESTTSEAERDALIEKATALQLKYVIDSAMLGVAQAGQRPKPEEIISAKFCEERNTPLIKAKRELINGIALTNRCRPLIGVGRAYIIVYGFESDVQFVQGLYNALIIHMQRSLAEEERRAGFGTVRGGRKELAAFRVSFAHAYARRIYARLLEIQKSQAQQADNETPGAALALRDRGAEVARYVKPLSGRASTYPSGANANAAGAVAGSSAADRADLGRKRVGEANRPAIGL